MKAYTQGITKQEFVAEMKAHQKADRFIRGSYWIENDQRGCAVGCGLKSVANLKGIEGLSTSAHALYETHLGIPEWLARVEDTLFEGMSLDKSKSWPVKFASAIQPGADLNRIKVPFLVMLMKHSLKSISSKAYMAGRTDETKSKIIRCQSSIKQMIKVLPEGKADKIEAARRECSDAAYAAAYAAYAAYAARAKAYNHYATELLKLLKGRKGSRKVASK